ncbi:branched-chain amino acid aminotransferase [Metabacillus herbersteinensis]|uniref:Branched-chain amino acid aminotransferase n=1 Tax=Metabacillus herbersteinensis TaxID=283816 RepID=A0ABV6GIX8_9BACI
MLTQSISLYIKENSLDHELALYQEEKEFAEKHELLPEGINVTVKEPQTRFVTSYVERVDKETEELISEEAAELFLKKPVSFVKQHKNEFIYMESPWLELINVDALMIEQDDVFKSINVLLGLKLKKKVGEKIKSVLSTKLSGKETSYQMMFNDKDGLWDLNFALDDIEGFNEELSFSEVYGMVYQFLFRMIEEVEENKREQP